MRKYTNKTVAGFVYHEGIGYAVQSFLDADSIEDPELARMWASAKQILDSITDYLKPFDPDAGESDG